MSTSVTLPFPLAENEGQRLTVLRKLGILDTPQESDFDLLTEIAAELCGTPYAFVVLIDAERIWVKSAFGLDVQGNALERGASPCAYTVVQGPPLLVENMDADTRMRGMPHDHYAMYAGAQLRTSDGIALGTLCVEDNRVRRLSDHQLDLLQRLAGQAVQLIELRAARRELQHQASTDALTGLANRRVFFERLRQEVARSKRSGSEFSLVVLDIDHFKSINDHFGHAAGDSVLQAVAEMLQHCSRGSDLVARFGGEEFCALLPDSAHEQALAWAERSRQRLMQLRFIDMPALRVTASFGVTTSSCELELTADAIFSAADRAAYQAKHAGRNRVEFCPLGEGAPVAQPEASASAAVGE